MKLACLISLFFLTVFCNTLFAQSAKSTTIKSLRVTDFESPYHEISVSKAGNDDEEDEDDDDYVMDSLVKVKSKKGDLIKPEELVEGSEVTITYIERDSLKVITEITLLTVNEKGKMDYKAMFDGFDNNTAIIGGRKVKLAEGGVIKGKGKENFKGFDDPELKKGCYMYVKGTLQPDGIIYANEITAKENPRTKDDARLLSFINTKFSGNGLQKFVDDADNTAAKPAATTKRYRGTVKVGEMNYMLVDDIKLQGYINEIGFKLLPEYVNEEAWQKENPDVFFSFYLIKDSVPNAFALPNGKVFVHTGLLSVVENEAQLAFVMSHEISHVLYKHGTARFVKSERNKKTANTLKKGGEAFNSVVGGITGRRLRKTTTAEKAEIASGLVGGSGLSNAGVVIGTAVAKSLFEKFSHDELSNLFSKRNEKEADMVGLYYTQNAGYDIREVPKFWNNMMAVNHDPTYIENLGASLKRSLAQNLDLRGNVSMSTQLLTIGTEALFNGSFKTIYISHPLAKTRLNTTYTALTSTYRANNFAQSTIGKEEYESYLRRLK